MVAILTIFNIIKIKFRLLLYRHDCIQTKNSCEKICLITIYKVAQSSAAETLL